MKQSFTVLILIYSMNSFAQNLSDPSLSTPSKRFTRTEILAGPSIVSIRDSPLTQYESSETDFGFAAGLGKGYILSPDFMIIGRIFYEKKGGIQTDAEQLGSVIYKNSITRKNIYECITIPLTIGYSLGNNVRYQFEAGAFISLTLQASINSKSSVSNYTVYNDITNGAKAIDFGFSFSFGMATRIRRADQISIRLLNIWGIPNILKTNTDTWRTFSLILMVGYPIPNFLPKNKTR